MAETFVKSFTHLKDMPKADRALPMLQRVASLVKPIMRKHAWVLPTLAEFFPDSPNLLDVNGGEQILLRLRPAWDPDTFLEEDAVVRTMLHELTHNVHGPHDEKFYKFLAGLEDEYDALQRSGYAGEGFFSPGHRLGAGVSHDLPQHLGRVRALDAAERRRKTEMLTNGGGRLGGRSSALDRLSPRELAARAAERRKRDEVVCGSGSLALREAAKAAKSSVVDNAIIDLTNDGDDTFATHRTLGSKSGSSWQPTFGPSRARNTPNPGPSADGQWTCPTCTLINAGLALQCDACLAIRPIDTSVGWACATCGERDIPHEFWSCRFCGAIKVHS
ncbi:WLM domain-containing protein [Boletus coccyginus]|nr:WLM domain-containing protein [Boletus coccyginus]